MNSNPQASKDADHHHSRHAWVPVRDLNARHRPKILSHLLALSPHDRYLRFGISTTDEQIKRYVASLDFRRDEAFGIFDERRQLIAFAHLADISSIEVGCDEPSTEFAVSVLPAARGRGWGERLFRMGALHTRNRGRHIMHIQALSENIPMLKIALRAGASLERDGAESNAWLRLKNDTVVTHVEGWFLNLAAQLHDRLRRRRAA